jgi:hypothetical protein
MIDPPCCSRKKKGKLFIFYERFSSNAMNKSIHTTEWQAEKNSCLLTKKTLTDMGSFPYTYTETLMDTETWTDMESLN